MGGVKGSPATTHSAPAGPIYEGQATFRGFPLYRLMDEFGAVFAIEEHYHDDKVRIGWKRGVVSPWETMEVDASLSREEIVTIIRATMRLTQ